MDACRRSRRIHSAEPKTAGSGTYTYVGAQQSSQQAPRGAGLGEVACPWQGWGKEREAGGQESFQILLEADWSVSPRRALPSARGSEPAERSRQVRCARRAGPSSRCCVCVAAPHRQPSVSWLTPPSGVAQKAPDVGGYALRPVNRLDHRFASSSVIGTFSHLSSFFLAGRQRRLLSRQASILFNAHC